MHFTGKQRVVMHHAQTCSLEGKLLEIQWKNFDTF